MALLPSHKSNCPPYGQSNEDIRQGQEDQVQQAVQAAHKAFYQLGKFNEGNVGKAGLLLSKLEIYC